MADEKITTSVKDDEFDPHKLLIQTGITLGLTTIALIILMIIFRDQANAFGQWFTTNFGLAGVAAFSYITDALIMPGAIDIAFPIAIQQNWDPVPLLVVMSVASILGGTTGWAIGHFFNHLKVVQKLVEFYRSKGENLIKRFGFWAVVIAALTPVPYSTVSWIAGMMKVPLPTYLLASLFRIPRILISYLLVYLALTGLLPWFGIGF